MTDIQIVVLGFSLLAIAIVYCVQAIYITVVWKEVMLNKAKRIQEDHNAMHKAYLNVIKDCNEKPIEDPTFCEMYNRIRKYRSNINNRNTGVSKYTNLFDTGQFYGSFQNKDMHCSKNKGFGMVVTGIRIV